MRSGFIVFAATASLLNVQAVAQRTLPWCESSQERDIGNGFRLTQYMFDGSSEFTLFFRPAEGDVRTNGVTMTAPFELMLSSLDLDGRTTPQIGYPNYQFRRPNGVRLGTGVLALNCGEGIALAATYSAEPPGDHVRAPITFYTPFFPQRALIPECLSAIESRSRLQFVVRETERSDPRVMIDGSMPLGQAIAEARRRWTAETARARRGLCRMPPRHRRLSDPERNPPPPR